MINFIKSLIPNALLGLGWLLDMLAKGVMVVSNLVTHLGIKLHMRLNTKLGQKFKTIEATVQAAVQQIQNMQKQLVEQQAGRRDESAKLANIVKGDNKPPVRLVSLRKKNDDESKG